MSLVYMYYRGEDGKFEKGDFVMKPEDYESEMNMSYEEGWNNGFDEGRDSIQNRKYSRVEVIAETGRDYVSWSEHTIMEQDDGKTLKIFKTLPEVNSAPVDDGSWDNVIEAMKKSPCACGKCKLADAWTGARRNE